MPSSPAIHFSRCRIGHFDHILLRDFSWHIGPGETWVITGSNGSGKSALVAALAGLLPVAPENGGCALPPPNQVALVSSEALSRLFLAERDNDESDFVEGGVDEGTLAGNFISRGLSGSGEALLASLITGLGLGAVLNRGIKYLSTGELRKLALARCLLSDPAWLVLDEVRDGLDAAARHWLAGHLEGLIEAGKPRLILVSDRYEALPAAISHVLHMVDGRVGFAGSRERYEQEWLPAQSEGAELPTASLAHLLPSPSSAGEDRSRILVEFRDVTVAWSGRTVIDRLTWRLERGSHTLMRGPNGCGKTTLLNLISGDNPQVYANDVTVLGFRRGSGESVWDIKSRIGMVSYQLHVEYLYHCDSTVEEVIISGFHDSIGLYEAVGDLERRTARAWLAALGLADRAGWAFTHLSYGEQRAVLIARAVVKQPDLLILDEPCHGLDSSHRHHALAIADYIGRQTDTTLLYVTHDPSEYLPCLRRVLEWQDGCWRETDFQPSILIRG